MVQAAGDKVIAPGVPNAQTFTANGTWTKPSGLRAVMVEVVGGGGAGGGAAATTANHTKGAGGGAGGYARKLWQASEVGSTMTVTVGAGGTGVSGAAGNAGGNSSIVSLVGTVTANGGGGGPVAAAATTSFGINGGSGGTATGGDVNSRCIRKWRQQCPRRWREGCVGGGHVECHRGCSWWPVRRRRLGCDQRRHRSRGHWRRRRGRRSYRHNVFLIN